MLPAQGHSDLLPTIYPLLAPYKQGLQWESLPQPAPPPPGSPCMSKRSTVWHRVSPLTPRPDALVAD